MATPQVLRIVDYGPYRQGQSPGNIPADVNVWDAQINLDLSIIHQTGANAVRIYGLDDGQSYIVSQAKKYDLEVIPSVFLANPNGVNGQKDPRPTFAAIVGQTPNIKQQLDNLVVVLNNPTTDLSNIPFVVVGNEEISQVGGWNDFAVLDAIQYVRSRTPAGIKFTTAESAGGQYYINPSGTQHNTRLGNGVDVIYANILPYWENVPVSQAVAQVLTEYRQLVATYPGKQIVISETGWPSAGSPNGPALPSLANEQIFWLEFAAAANQNGISYGAFEAFDEPWKAAAIPGNTVDAFWGLFGNSRDPKVPDLSLSASPINPTTLGQPVFRFFDTHDGGHFFTTNPIERDQVLATRPDMTFEGVGYGAVDPSINDPNAAPVFRFFDTHDGGHFFTTSLVERDQVLSTRPDLRFEGVGYLEHAAQQAGDSAVYRFFETTSGGHFFTASAVERDTVMATRSDMRFEGIAFYAPA